MPKIVHKQKSLLGGEVYLDENFRVIGHAQRVLFLLLVLVERDGELEEAVVEYDRGESVHMHFSDSGGTDGLL